MLWKSDLYLVDGVSRVLLVFRNYQSFNENMKIIFKTNEKAQEIKNTHTTKYVNRS